MDNHAPVLSRRNVIFGYLPILVVLLIVVYVRVRLLDVPLERDEGEFAYMGQLLIRGNIPFQNAYSMKFPGVSVIYALFMLLFGQTLLGIHLGLLIVNLLSTGLIWLLARRLFEMRTATAAAMIYPILSLSQGVYGVSAHATHFVVLFALVGFVLTLYSSGRDSKCLAALCGLSFGLAVTMKQHAVTLALFALLYLLWKQHRKGHSPRDLALKGALFVAGLALPVAAILLWVERAGVFDRFWFWTVKYARTYVAKDPLANGLLSFIQSIVSAVYSVAGFHPEVWTAAAVGIVLLLARRNLKDERLFVLGFLCSAFLAVCPGFYFRPHYFVLILPPVALLAGLAVTQSAEIVLANFPPWLKNAVPLVVVALVIGAGIYQERSYLFGLTPEEVSRDTFGVAPFPESVTVASYLKKHSSPEDRIAVLGSEPQIYFYAERLSATGHIYMYGLMEEQPFAEQMQDEMISEIELAQPIFIVDVRVKESWLVTAHSPMKLRIWADSYLAKHYSLVGITEMFENGARSFWDRGVTGYTACSDAVIYVWRRLPA